MKKLFFSALLLVATSAMAAGELDQDNTNQGLSGAVVVRVDSRDQSVAILKSEQIPASNQEAQTLAQTGTFEIAKAQNIRSELDQEAGASSWYWHCGYNYYPTYLYWYGYNYYPTYTYYYSSYTYYYYYGYRW